MNCRSQQVCFFTIYIKLIVIKAMGIVKKDIDIDILVRGIKLAEISYDFFKCSEVYMHHGQTILSHYMITKDNKPEIV